MKLWKIFRKPAPQGSHHEPKTERFMGTVRAADAEKAVEAYADWSSIPEHELRAEFLK